MGLRRRWKAHVENAKEKSWERAADEGEAGIDLEDIGEHMNDALPEPVAASGWSWRTGLFSFFGFWR